MLPISADSKGVFASDKKTFASDEKTFGVRHANQPTVHIVQ